MTSKSIFIVLKYFIIAILLFAFLVADSLWRASPGFLGSITREITSVFCDPATQWMFVFCLVCYYIILLFLERRTEFQSSVTVDANRVNFPGIIKALGRIYVQSHHWFSSPNFWLTALVVLALLRYAFTYQTASSSTQVSILLAGIVFGKAISTWSQYHNPCAGRHAACLIGLLASLLIVVAFLQPERMTFQYHDVIRWSGVWENPNLYGLMMSVGLVLIVGIGIQKWQMADERWRKTICMVLSFIAVILTGYCLFKSYSRGAWVSTMGGLSYLSWHIVQNPIKSKIQKFLCDLCIPRLRKNWHPMLVALASVLMLSFWRFNQTEWVPARRVFSTVTPVDFSWRNRVAAWKGTLQITAEHPWFGVGWNQPEPLYGHYYLPSELNESAAIEMNDYLMLDATLGIPALFCFVMYLWLSLVDRSWQIEDGNKSTTLNLRPWALDSLQAACRAGAIVLLIGFWFDGGLFKLATASTFWILLELGRQDLQPAA